MAQAINGVSGQTGVTAQLSGDKASITLVHATGEDIKLTNAISSAASVTVQGVAADGSTVTGSLLVVMFPFIRLKGLPFKTVVPP